jgi:hypothetical protein
MSKAKDMMITYNTPASPGHVCISPILFSLVLGQSHFLVFHPYLSFQCQRLSNGVGWSLGERHQATAIQFELLLSSYWIKKKLLFPFHLFMSNVHSSSLCIFAIRFSLTFVWQV